MKKKTVITPPPPKQKVLLAPLHPSIWHSRVPAVITASILGVLFLGSGGLAMLHITNELAYDAAAIVTSNRPTAVSPFPVGVDPERKLITENPAADTYLENPASRSLADASWWMPKAVRTLTELPWYQNLASPMGRILIIEPGERKEQVVDHFGRLLGWDEDERADFARRITESSPSLTEGKFYPGTYVIARGSSPAVAANAVLTRFESEVLARYPSEIEGVVPIEDTLTIASLLEREAYDFDDMRLISGVIWNRLFAGMKLQLDATMQYARGERGDWWPVPRPADKDIDSPYNTYRVSGLPPAPIASPSLSAILAALNPRETDCMYYFHDAKGGFHCTKTYEEHVAALKVVYGSGQ